MSILQIVRDQSLKSYNTFGVEATASFFVQITSEKQLTDLFSHDLFKKYTHLVIGGGSNVLFTQTFAGLIVKNSITGIKVHEDGDYVLVSAGGGMVWDELVQYCVQNGYGGIENLSLIPGTVGASPVQNIGAYGVELEDVFYSCRAFDLQEGKFEEFLKSDCQFSYRDSIFKNAYKGRFIITEVTYQLSKKHQFNISYGAVKEELERMGVQELNISAISQAVASIRVRKLPDPSTIGNAGSFFKNPIIALPEFEPLVKAYPDIIHFSAGPGQVKLAAGWMIEKAGFKGLRRGDTGTWKHQALVIVNHKNATGKEVYNFSEKIVKEVYNKFKILLEREVNIF